MKIAIRPIVGLCCALASLAACDNRAESQSTAVSGT